MHQLKESSNTMIASSIEKYEEILKKCTKSPGKKSNLKFCPISAVLIKLNLCIPETKEFPCRLPSGKLDSDEEEMSLKSYI